MWPGTYSLAAKFFPTGGTVMFAVLALAGDMGCSTGPAIIGRISVFVQNTGTKLIPFITGSDITEIGLKTGIAIVGLFPLIMLIAVFFLKRKKN